MAKYSIKKSPLPQPSALPPIESQNSKLKRDHSFVQSKPGRPATSVKSNRQPSPKLEKGKPKPVVKNKNFRYIPDGHC